MSTNLTAENASREAAARERRAWRYRLRDLLQGFSPYPRIQVCGRFRASDERPITVRVDDGVAHFTNLQLCASVHQCATCSAKIRQVRADEIARAVNRHLAAGGGAEFVTLTMRHHRGQALSTLLDGCVEAWRSITAHRWWKQSVARDLGVVGTIRALEVTHGGRNGWHPHLHILVLTERQLEPGERARFVDQLFAQWSGALESHGMLLPMRGPGVKVVQVRDGDGIGAYTSKVIGLELQRHDLKAARREREYATRPVFAIAAAVMELGTVDDLTLWHEYERAIHGRAALTWSRGLKARLLIEEVSDEEIVETPESGEVVAVIGTSLWGLILKARARWRVLELAAHDPDALPEFFAKLETDAWEVVRC